jgi:exodeoxyribonuclease VII large subunit
VGAKVEAQLVGDRKVYTVAAFNRGVSLWLGRLPEVWVEGELTELRRNARWARVFFTLKDPATGSCLSASIARSRYDRLDLRLEEGEKVHVLGRAELFEAKGELALRATTIERAGLGAHLAALERLRRTLAAEGLFADERKRALPRYPRAVGVVTGTDAAARGDIVTAIRTRFPPARLVVAETRVQGRGAPEAICRALAAVAGHPAVDVVVLTRGGGSFEDLLPFSAEPVVRAVAASPVPVVSAVGHEQDAPLCDLAADVRASTPTAAARLVVPDLDELVAGLGRSRDALEAGVRRLLERDRERVARLAERLRAAPALLLERRRAAVEVAGARLRALSPAATVARGYAIVRAGGAVVREAAAVRPGEAIDVELAAGSLSARVDEVRP